MYGEISKVVVFPPNLGRTVEGCCCCVLESMASGVTVVLGSPFGSAEIAPTSCGTSGRSSVLCGTYCPPRASRVECRGFC